MRPGLRKLLLFGALGGIVALLLLDEPQKAAGISAASGVTGEARGEKAVESLQLPERRGLEKTRGELFAAPPPPKAKAPAVTVVAPAPVAPPFPYRFAGKVLRGGEEEVLITKGDVVFPIKVGDTLDGMYRVESIGAERIEFVYLPLGTKERLSVSSVFDADRSPAPTVAAPAAAPISVDGKPAQLRWEGPGQVQAGASFSVALRVSTPEALRAAPMQLRFEPDVLKPVNVRPGKFFGEGNFTYRVNPEGSIFVGARTSAAAPGSDAELLVLTFLPIKRGATAELTMSALSLQGAAGRAIAHQQIPAFRTAIH